MYHTKPNIFVNTNGAVFLFLGKNTGFAFRASSCCRKGFVW